MIRTFGAIFDHVSFFTAVEAGSAAASETAAGAIKVARRVATFGSTSALEASSAIIASLGEINLDFVADEFLTISSE